MEDTRVTYRSRWKKISSEFFTRIGERDTFIFNATGKYFALEQRKVKAKGN